MATDSGDESQLLEERFLTYTPIIYTRYTTHYKITLHYSILYYQTAHVQSSVEQCSSASAEAVLPCQTSPSFGSSCLVVAVV